MWHPEDTFQEDVEPTTYLVSQRNQSLYKAYQKQYSRNPFDEETLETGDRLTDMMTKERKEKWEELITSTDLTHNSPKA